MQLFEFGLQLPGHSDFTINYGLHQQPSAQTGDFVLSHMSHTILHRELLAAPFRQNHLLAVKKNFSPTDELFLSLHANFLPSGQRKYDGRARFCTGNIPDWMRWQLSCQRISLKASDALLLPCPHVSCVIKDMDRLEKQSLVMFSVYKALAITCYADKEWESLIS